MSASPSSKYKIEKGVPVPPRKGGPNGGGSRKALAAEIAVGDSFLLDGWKNGPAQSLVVSLRKYAPEAKFTSRAVDGGIRVWRVA